jgi:hypothetical protein
MVPPPRQQRPRPGHRRWQTRQGLVQVSARIGYVLCHRARPSPQMPGDHPVRPSFETSDKRLYVVSPGISPITVRQPFRPARVSGRRARRPATPRPRLLGTRLAAPASDASPQGRPQSGEDLPAGRLRRRRRRGCRWRAGPGCRVPVVAEPGIRTLRIPSPHRGGSHRSRPGHGGRQLAASRCTLETGEGSDGRQPHRRRGTARRHAADLG